MKKNVDKILQDMQKFNERLAAGDAAAHALGRKMLVEAGIIEKTARGKYRLTAMYRPTGDSSSQPGHVACNDETGAQITHPPLKRKRKKTG